MPQKPTCGSVVVESTGCPLHCTHPPASIRTRSGGPFMRLLALIAALALIGGAVGACDRRECPAPPVALPSAPQTIGWLDGGYGIVPGEMDDHPVALLLNT